MSMPFLRGSANSARMRPFAGQPNRVAADATGGGGFGGVSRFGGSSRLGNSLASGRASTLPTPRAALACARPGGGVTRSCWPTWMRVGSSRLFHCATSR
jgi:hypothetical protein